MVRKPLEDMKIYNFSVDNKKFMGYGIINCPACKTRIHLEIGDHDFFEKVKCHTCENEIDIIYTI